MQREKERTGKQAPDKRKVEEKNVPKTPGGSD
jgi:hypothetical protein